MYINNIINSGPHDHVSRDTRVMPADGEHIKVCMPLGAQTVNAVRQPSSLDIPYPCHGAVDAALYSCRRE